MSAHSLNGPSSFSRRIGCPGSARMEKDLPEQSSPFAAEGTAAHELGEKCLINDHEPAEYAGETIIVDKDGPAQSFKVDEDMIEAVQEYVDYCRPLMGNHMIEEKFALPFLGKDQKGTSDFTALHENILHVVDYKHGKGVPVDVIGNVQGLCYGLGAAKEFTNEPWDTLRITIVQPRAYHEDGGIRWWDVPREELLDYMVNYAYYAKLTEDPDAPLSVGSWCWFCKAKPICPQHYANAQEVMQMEFSDPTSLPIPIEFLSDAEIADLVLNKIKIIEDWCSSVKDHAQRRAEAGNALPGTKLVHTRANRVWADPVQAEAFFSSQLGDKVYEKKFMSAPKVERLVGKKKFEDFSDMVDKISTGVTLVAESDERPNARPSVSSEFS
jgi:hypothetical protein